MKYLSILFLGFVTFSCCVRQENENSKVLKIELPIDSVVYATYNRNKNSKLEQSDTIDYKHYYHMVEGNNGYFYFCYDYIEDLGKIHKYAYQIFPQQNILKFFDNVNSSVFDLKLVDTLIIPIDNISYKIEKYCKPACDTDSIFSPENYHYINDRLGVIAVENVHYKTFVAIRNSAVDDSGMTYISKKIIDHIECCSNFER